MQIVKQCQSSGSLICKGTAIKVKICKKGKEADCVVTYVSKRKRLATFTIIMLLVNCCTRPPSSFPVLQNIVPDDQKLSILQIADIIAKRKESTVFEMSNTQIVCLQLHLEDDPASRMARQLSGMTALPAARPQLWETFQHDRPSWVRIPTSRRRSCCQQALNIEKSSVLKRKIL